MKSEEPDSHVDYCDKGFSTPIENLKLLFQLLYLVPSAVFQVRVIYIIAWKHWKKFRSQSFFMIFLADCITGFFLVLISIFFSRPIMYLPQSCEYFLDFLENHLYLLDLYYPFFRYLQAFQILLQMLFIANRASCVIWPMDYGTFWKNNLRWILWMLAVLPLLWIWTIVPSTKIVWHAYGGLFVAYKRYFNWARNNLFFAVLRGTSVIFIVIASIITVLKMTKMKTRIKKSEQTLCWASACLSICYITPAIAEFQYYRTNGNLSNSDILYGLILMSWDIQNIGSTFVMLIMNAPFRRSVLWNTKINVTWEDVQKKKKIIHVTSGTHFS